LLLYLIASPVALSVAIVALALINSAIAWQAQRATARQSVIRISDAASAEPTSRSSLRSMAPSFVFTGIVAALSFVPSRLMREAIGGGYLVLQLTTMAINLDSFFRVRSVGIPGAAEGSVRFSTSYRFRAAAGQAFALALFDAAVAWLFSSITFFVGSLFVMATALGWYRRAKQTAAQRT
jgi:hypothetical protein